TFIIVFVGKAIKTAAIVPAIIIKIAAGLIKADIETPLITIPTPTATIPSIKPITEVLSMLNPPKIKQDYYSFFNSTYILSISFIKSIIEVISIINPTKIKQCYYSFFKSTHLLLISVNNSVV